MPETVVRRFIGPPLSMFASGATCLTTLTRERHRLTPRPSNRWQRERAHAGLLIRASAAVSWSARAGILPQIAAEHLLDLRAPPAPGPPVAGRGCRGRAQARRQRVVERQLAPGLVAPGEEAEPDGECGDEVRARQAAPPCLAQHRQPAHGDLLRAVHGDLQRAVLQRPVREPAQEGLDIGLDVEARRAAG